MSEITLTVVPGCQTGDSSGMSEDGDEVSTVFRTGHPCVYCP